MQVRVLVIMLVAVRVASAEPAEPYPVTLVDRPLVLPAGMTTLDFSVDLPTYLDRTTDAMGNPTTTRTQLGHFHNLDLNVDHAFGPVEINVGGVGAFRYLAAHVGAFVATGESGAAGISLGYLFSDGETDISQSAFYTHRLYRESGLFALYASGGIDATEARETPWMGPPSSAHVLGVDGSVGGNLQLAPNLALAEVVSAGVPVSRSNTNASAYASELTTLIASLQHWDFYGQFGVIDLTSTHRLFAAVGFTHRWD